MIRMIRSVFRNSSALRRKLSIKNKKWYGFALLLLWCPSIFFLLLVSIYFYIYVLCYLAPDASDHALPLFISILFHFPPGVWHTYDAVSRFGTHHSNDDPIFLNIIIQMNVHMNSDIITNNIISKNLFHNLQFTRRFVCQIRF